MTIGEALKAFFRIFKGGKRAPKSYKMLRILSASPDELRRIEEDPELLDREWPG